MTAYHAVLQEELTNLRDLPSAVDLERFISRKRHGTFEQYERDLSAQVRRLECELKASELARSDVDDSVISVEGKEYRLCLKKEEKTYLTSSGPVTVARNLFRPSGGGRAVCPLDFRVGMVGVCTPLLARQTTFLMGHLTSGETASVFKEMGVEGPSSSTCDRLPKVLNPKWEQRRAEWETELREMETVPEAATVVAASLDGVMVADKQAQKDAKAARATAAENGDSKQASGPAGYREVGCGTVSLYAPPKDPDSDNDDERAPQRLDTVRYGRAPEYKKKTLSEQLDAELDSILAARPDLEVVALADGAEENWRYFDDPRWDNATKIVDHGHASQHLKAGLVAGYGDTVDARAEYERLRLILRDKFGGVGQVISELDRLDRKMHAENHPRRRKLLKKERTYFRNQKDRMDYAAYQKRGLPIGSGIVEAACKTLAAQRLKRSGMNWGDGKQPILTIRSLQQSNRWDRGWAIAARQFLKDVFRVSERGHLKSIQPVGKAA